MKDKNHYPQIKNEVNRITALKGAVKHGLFEFKTTFLGKWSMGMVTYDAGRDFYTVSYMSENELHGDFQDSFCGHYLRIINKVLYFVDEPEQKINKNATGFILAFFDATDAELNLEATLKNISE